MWQADALDGGSDAFGNRQRAVRIGVAQDEQQLLSAEPVGDVVASQGAVDRGGDRLERIVAGEVAETIVICLEVVDIADGERDRLLRAAAQRGQCGKVVGERVPVAQARERVAP